MTFRTLSLAASFLLLAACGDDTAGAGGAGTGGSGGVGGAGGDPTTTTGTDTTSTTTTTTTGAGGDDTTSAGGAGGEDTTSAGGAGGESSTSAGGGSACDGEGFVAVTEDAGGIQDTFLYFALSADQAPQDDLSFELYSSIGEAGDRIILEENYSVCDPCVLLRLGCDDNFDNCSQKFLAQGGTIEIDSFEGTFSGTLRDVELIEVEIGEGAVSTPVPGGETWCLDGYTFEAPIQE